MTNSIQNGLIPYKMVPLPNPDTPYMQLLPSLGVDYGQCFLPLGDQWLASVAVQIPYKIESFLPRNLYISI